MTNADRSMVWVRGSLARWEAFLLFVLIGTFISGTDIGLLFDALADRRALLFQLGSCHCE